MNRTSLSIGLDGEVHDFELRGTVLPERIPVIPEGDDDLTSCKSWHREGFVTAELLTSEELEFLQAAVLTVCKSVLGQSGACFERLVDYHHVVGHEHQHREVLAALRDQLPGLIGPAICQVIDERVSGLVGLSVTSVHSSLAVERIRARLVRPGRTDFNPPHRDSWINHLRNGINAYIPLAGSDARTSLAVLPGSHLASNPLLRTTGGAVLDAIEFHVPAVAESVELVRPNPQVGQSLLFSSYLLHGMGMNQREDETRASLEMRFWATDRSPGDRHG